MLGSLDGPGREEGKAQPAQMKGLPFLYPQQRYFSCVMALAVAAGGRKSARAGEPAPEVVAVVHDGPKAGAGAERYVLLITDAPPL